MTLDQRRSLEGECHVEKDNELALRNRRASICQRVLGEFLADDSAGGLCTRLERRIQRRQRFVA
jgi:hypothetical protein